MIEWSLHEGQLQRPYACITCGGNLGQMVDTHREIPAVGNIYVCADCVRSLARVVGLVRGKQLTNLTHQAKELEQKDADLRKALDLAIEFEQKADEMTKLAQGLTDELDLARQRVKQLEDRFAQHARESMELAGVALGDNEEE